MEDKICPLLSMSPKEALIAMKKVLCIKDACAWYVKYERSEGCAIKKLSDFLIGIRSKIITSNK